MCLISIVSKDQSIDDELYDHVWHSNPDGVGIMWHQDGKNHIFRTLDYNKGLDKVHQLNGKVDQYVIHWRLATHGPSDMPNCHPFSIGKTNIHMMHNGIFSGEYYRQPKKSDTAIFAEDLLFYFSHRPENIYTESVRKVIEHMAGYNMLAFLCPNGELWKTRSKEWVEYEGKLFSNEYMLPISWYSYYGV